MSPLLVPPSRFVQRQEALLAALGIAGDDMPRAVAGVGSSAMVSGTLYFMAIGLAAGDRVTNILDLVATLGSGFSGVGLKFGLYSKTGGSKLGETADVSGTHGSTGAKINALTAAYDVPTSDAYFLAGISIATTGPALMRGGSTNTGYGFAGAGIGVFGAITGQTDLPASFTPAYGSGSSLGFYLGWS